MMNPHWGGESSTASSKKKGKQRRVDHNRTKSPTPERVLGAAMDVDRISVESSSSSNPLDDHILDYVGFGQDAPMNNQHGVHPQGAQAMNTPSNGQQGPAHRSWAPVLPGREELDRMQLEALAAQAMPGAGQQEFDDASSSYWTEPTLSHDSWIDEMELLNPGALEALNEWLADPFSELEILYTKDGFPYSVQNGSKPYICRCVGCKKQDRTLKKEDRTFVNMAALLKHQKNHQSKEVMAFKCPTCGKPFVLRHYVLRHLKVHSDERPFGCENCPLRFKRKDQLTRHLNSKRGCQLALKRLSTASSTDAPQTPSTVSEAVQVGPIKDVTDGLEQVEIASTSSFPLSPTQNPRQGF